MDFLKNYPDGIHLIDFEFRPANGREGNQPEPTCLVVREYPSGNTRRYWQDDLAIMKSAPFPVSPGAMSVAYFASAEMDCFLRLGWALPDNLLDLFTEFRCRTNGIGAPFGNGLVGALQYFGLPAMDVDAKDEMRNLALRGGPWTGQEKADLLDYCESDVVALHRLLDAMGPKIDWPRALLRGRYMKAVSHMQKVGVPIDMVMLDLLMANWEELKAALIAQVDADFGVFDAGTFKASLWAQYLARENIEWPMRSDGSLLLDDDTFKSMAKVHPKINPIRELRASLSAMRLSGLTVGDDGRNRCLLSPFKSVTGRNQPSNTKFIFGPAVWMRGLIKPKPGYGLAYIDYSQQEFGIAAALSGDLAMQKAYESGDPYLAFAKQAGAVPSQATKESHKAEREQFKACVLAVQYGMGEDALAIRIGQPVARARKLLTLHRQTYAAFWKWSDACLDEAVLNRRLWASYGWTHHIAESFNPRSLRNFPMQANGAEMLRLACILLTEAGINVCAPVHDALLVEVPLAHLNERVSVAKDLMGYASEQVLDGFRLSSDVKLVLDSERYMDDRGVEMWDRIESMLASSNVTGGV
jgi:DNA polymerase-1